MLQIDEIFGVTIQGEGKRIGNPSIFIRFGRCNMKCSGFKVGYKTPSGIKKYGCDSFYASDNAFKNMWQNYNDFKEIIKQINKLLPTTYKPDIVITGGEPLLYWEDEEFQKLLKYFIDNNFYLFLISFSYIIGNFNLKIFVTTLNRIAINILMPNP